MKKNYFITLITLLTFSPLFSQNLDLSILTIPDSLKTNANAVIRYDHTNIEMLSASNMTIQKEFAVTILNKHGDTEGKLEIYYDDHRKIKDVEIRVYNALGSEIKKIKKSDFKDVSATGGSLYTDDRVKYYHHTPLSYPYTIKYTYEISTPNTAFLERWVPINYYYVSTQLSSYTLTHPADIKIKFKENNFKNYNIENNSSVKKLSYTLKNARAIKYEPLSPDFLSYGPSANFAANKFHIAGVSGQAENWEEFGKWEYDNLLSGRQELPESTINEIKVLTKGVESSEKKARLVYDYMQEKTRYVSVQIGVGGWKPMLAEDVDRLGYGDCKALTNYTYSLLKVAGVESYYTSLYAGKRKDIDKDLASMQGNHVILMVPVKKDTVWLECTNQKNPFGYLGKFTDDRDVVISTPEGGKIIHTKSYKNTENKQNIKGECTLDENGHISVKAKIESFGIQYDDNYYISDYDSKEKDSYYKGFFERINNIKITSIDLNNDDINTCFTEDIEFTAANYAVLSGERMLVRLNALNPNGNIPKRIRNRKLPLEIQYGFTDIDEIIINLPKNYAIEAMAGAKVLETKFGNYKMNIEKISEHQLKYSRELLIKQGLYTVSDYEKYRSFRKKINQLDNSKIVLIKI